MTGPFTEPHQSSILFSSQCFNTGSPSLFVPCEISLPFRFWDKNVCALLISSMHAACSVLGHSYMITWILFGKEYTLQSASFCGFLFLLLTSFTLGPIILCITLFPYTINLLLLWIVWCDPHYKMIDYYTCHVIVVLCVLILANVSGRKTTDSKVKGYGDSRIPSTAHFFVNIILIFHDYSSEIFQLCHNSRGFIGWLYIMIF